MAINSRQDLAEFCLRQLGAPVVNIEIADEQMEDNIELAIEYYHEYHFDGIERDYLSLAITATKLTVADASGFSVGNVVYQGATSDLPPIATITAINGNVITIDRTINNKLFYVSATVPLTNGTYSSIISVADIGTVDNRYFEVEESVVGVKKLLNITNVISSSETLFNVNYQIMMSEVRNLTSQGSAYLYGTMQYLGNLDFIMKTEKDYRFNRRMGRIYVDIDWGRSVKIGDILVAEIYRYVDDKLYKKVLNDTWLKEYSTALFKKQWGTNLKKYSGMTLPGGIQYNGQQIFDEAIRDIEVLQDQAINSSAPLEFMVG